MHFEELSSITSDLDAQASEFTMKYHIAKTLLYFCHLQNSDAYHSIRSQSYVLTKQHPIHFHQTIQLPFALH